MAISIVEAYHACWSRGDVAGMMSWCTESYILYLSSGTPNGDPLTLHGKTAVSDFLTPIAAVTESSTQPYSYRFNDGVLRTQVQASVTHRASGHKLTSNYRQVLAFSGFKISSSEEFHDDAMIRAFWTMVKNSTKAMLLGIICSTVHPTILAP